MELLSDLVEERRITVVVVTHEPSIADWSTRSILMRDGLILDDHTSDSPMNDQI